MSQLLEQLSRQQYANYDCIYCGNNFMPSLHGGFGFQQEIGSGICKECDESDMWRMEDTDYRTDIIKTDIEDVNRVPDKG